MVLVFLLDHGLVLRQSATQSRVMIRVDVDCGVPNGAAHIRTRAMRPCSSPFQSALRSAPAQLQPLRQPCGSRCEPLNAAQGGAG